MAHVLVVEDDPTIRRAMTVSLALDDHEVEVAADLSRGVELLEHGRFDLVLTELFSPTFSPEALHALDAFTRTAPETPVVVATADDQAATIEPASYGLAAILLKPFHVETLRACVRRVVKEQAERSAARRARAEES
jgi:DNA-binding NtrC family response regulator